MSTCMHASGNMHGISQAGFPDGENSVFSLGNVLNWPPLVSIKSLCDSVATQKQN